MLLGEEVKEEERERAIERRRGGGVKKKKKTGNCLVTYVYADAQRIENDPCDTVVVSGNSDEINITGNRIFEGIVGIICNV